MGLMKEFRDFIMRGNVIDLAVAVVIGAAFGTVVKSLVDDIIMPPIGLLLGGVDFTNLFINLSDQPAASLAEAQAAGLPTINYGLFINNIISFLIVALAIFLIVKAYQSALRRGKTEEATLPTETDCPYCLRAIPIGATRCPECTSQLTAGSAAAD